MRKEEEGGRRGEGWNEQGIRGRREGGLRKEEEGGRRGEGWSEQGIRGRREGGREERGRGGSEQGISGRREGGREGGEGRGGVNKGSEGGGREGGKKGGEGEGRTNWLKRDQEKCTKHVKLGHIQNHSYAIRCHLMLVSVALSLVPFSASNLSDVLCSCRFRLTSAPRNGLADDILRSDWRVAIYIHTIIKVW